MDSSSLDWLGNKFVTADGNELTLENVKKCQLILVLYSASW